MIIENYDSIRLCEHTPDQTYTRHPCSCGRELWPPRGRGRGESLTSPRRIDAKLRALEAMQLHVQGYTYQVIAAKLGYHHADSAWRAVQRIRDQHAAWSRFERETGRRRYETRSTRRQLTDRELEAIRYDLTNGLDAERLEAAQGRLVQLLKEHGRHKNELGKKEII